MPTSVCAHLLACEPAGSAEVVELLLVGGGASGGPRRSPRALWPTCGGRWRRRLMSACVPCCCTSLAWLRRCCSIRRQQVICSESLELAAILQCGRSLRPTWLSCWCSRGSWDAGAEVVRAALEEFADRAVNLGDSSSSAVTRLRMWWEWFGAYDPRLVGEFRSPPPGVARRGPRADRWGRVRSLGCSQACWHGGGEPAATVLGPARSRAGTATACSAMWTRSP